ncbi:hypothetical protein, partial [Escherichia coli]|uniref:hypothetical protein n=1 Tax=Escherichia coli TaxID=562 RepID=UPI001CCCB501
FMRNFGNTIGAAIFGAVLNGSLLSSFRERNLDYKVNDINLLLTEEARSTLPASNVNTLHHALDGSLQWVYVAVLVFAVISLLLILRIPRGKVVSHDDN